MLFNLFTLVPRWTESETVTVNSKYKKESLNRKEPDPRIKNTTGVCELRFRIFEHLKKIK